MIVDITIDAKTTDAEIKFEFALIKDIKDTMDSVAIISMIAGDYSLDPELDLEDFKELVNKGLTGGNKYITFDINEDGIEAEYSK